MSSSSNGVRYMLTPGFLKDVVLLSWRSGCVLAVLFPGLLALLGVASPSTIQQGGTAHANLAYAGQKPANALYVLHEFSESAATPVRKEIRFLEDSKNIVIDSPKFNEEIQSPLVITGKARGVWFFEGEFPVTLKDADGKVLVRSWARAEGSWMTTDFVPFKLEVKFHPPLTKTGVLVFEKSSQKTGEVHERVELPIRFLTP